MKKKIASIFVILLFAGIFLASATVQTDDKSEMSAEESEFEPEPLIIETSRDAPQGIYHVTIIINGETIEDAGYEGLAFVEMDGKYMRISCTDAVRSRFGDYF